MGVSSRSPFLALEFLPDPAAHAPPPIFLLDPPLLVSSRVESSLSPFSHTFLLPKLSHGVPLAEDSRRSVNTAVAEAPLSVRGIEPSLLAHRLAVFLALPLQRSLRARNCGNLELMWQLRNGGWPRRLTWRQRRPSKGNRPMSKQKMR